jgi:anaerobic selenocysteine-containing dehydrogenase
MCGLELTVEGERVTKVRPDPDDVWSKGYICPKGAVIQHLHEDPDRLRVPMIRDGATWREASWPEAFARADVLIAGVLERHGKSAITAYIGNPTAHNFSLGRYVGLFVGLANLAVIYSAGTVDQWPKNLSCMLMLGAMWWIPVPDLRRTHYWLVMGANPDASQGSLLACPDLMGEIDRIRARGGKTVVVDPRRTGTAERADEWVAIRPGTDAALLLAICHVLFAENLARIEQRHDRSLADRVNGLEEIRLLAAGWPPERVERACHVPAETVRRIAREIAAAPSAAVYGRIGLCTQEFGTLASWLVDVVNVLTGNFDRPGGAMFGNPIAWSMTSLPDPQWAHGFALGRFRSRVRGAPEVLGQFPLSCLAEEIATPGEGQVKALITIAGNPVISAPDAARLDAALPLLECMISVDNYLNETTRHAHVIFPGLSPLEQPHYDDLITMWAVHTAGNFSPAVFPRADRPAEWEILTRLGAYISGMRENDVDVSAIDDGFFAALCAMKGIDAAAVSPIYMDRGPERLLDLQIRTGPFGDCYGKNPGGLTLQSFRDAPHGIDIGPLVPRLDEVLATASGKIELAPRELLADVPRLAERIDALGAGERGQAPLGPVPSGVESGQAPLGPVPAELLLISRRHLRSNNSWCHNVAPLMTGRERCTLLVHPDDARRCGLVDGASARVTSAAGSVVVPVEVSDEMMPGVVSLPHGWGHDKDGTRMRVAREHAGVNNNVLAPGQLVDRVSNNAVVNGIPVQVRGL